MNPRSPSRTLSNNVRRKAAHALQPATAHAPIPFEPEPVPVLPSPEVELPSVSNPEPATPRPGRPQLLDACEESEDFFQLTASLLEHYHPGTTHECSLIEDLACDRWQLLRRQRAVNAIEAELFQSQPEPAQWPETAFNRLALADRYRIQAERTFHRSLKLVKEFSKERVATYRWEAMYDVAVRQLEFQKKKHELETNERVKRMDGAA